MFIGRSCRAGGMAKGKDDLILKDRMQFELDANGNVATLYGRVDLSDYVSIPKSEGLKVKQIRFQVRDTTSDQTGSFDQVLKPSFQTNTFSNLKIYATTTAYENAQDVGIGSPNVIALVEHQSYNNIFVDPGTGPVGGNTIISYFEYGVPDLHPDGFPVVTDMLIGVAAHDCERYANETLELDIMIVAEPAKITKDDMEMMLTQATDI